MTMQPKLERGSGPVIRFSEASLAYLVKIHIYEMLFAGGNVRYFKLNVYTLEGANWKTRVVYAGACIT